MTKQNEIQGRRQNILAEMNEIKRMRRGALTEQRRNITKGGRVKKGASCYHLQIWENGKNTTKYIPVTEAEQVKSDVENHKRFQCLAEEFAKITEEITLHSSDSKKKPVKRKSASRKK